MKRVSFSALVLLVAACGDAPPSAPPAYNGPQGTAPSNPGAGTLAGQPAPGVEVPAGDLTIQHALQYPTRVATGPAGRIYVSDVRVGSVFVLDPSGRILGELKGLAKPLGVAVDSAGRIYVGNQGRRNVEVYGPNGAKLWTVTDEALRMPNDLAVDSAGNLYVADSAAHVVRSYGMNGQHRFTIGGLGTGDGSFRFPAAVAISPGADGELFVGDQGHGRVQVFGLDGTFRRAFGQAMSAFSADWQGKFVRLQALAVDASGRLHVADTGLTTVQILDPLTGAYLGHYGAMGTGPGQLNLPLGLALDRGGVAWVANAGNTRVERLPNAAQGGE